MKKNITFGSEALTQIAKGVEILAKTVGSTLGPGGRNVIFENLGFPLVTKDGVTVASQIELKDKLQNIGAQMVKQVAKKTCDDAGDGPQPLYSKVLTPNGWKTMGEIKVGDVICGTNGTTQTVVGVFPKGEKEIYKMVFANKRVVECCEDHPWFVESGLILSPKLLLSLDEKTIEHLNFPIESPECNGYVKLIDIIPTGEKTEMQCIKVSNDDELYITDNYIVTHNTTSSVVLANAIVQEGLKVLSTGVNPIDVHRGILKAIEAVVEYIEKNIKVDVNDDLSKVQQIAKVSANWDEELAEVIANSITEVGINGAIRLEENRGFQTDYTIVDGLQFDRGYVTSYFINNQAKQICEMENPYVMFYAGELKDCAAILPILKEAKRDKKNLFIVAEKFEEDVLKQLAMSKTRSGVSVCAIKAPWYKDMCYDSLHDIAVLMGGTFFDPNDPDCIPLEDVRLKHCGRCDKVTCSLQRTSFVGFGNYPDEAMRKAWKERLDARVKEIEELSKDTEADKLPRENAKIRLKQINAKAAIISIGASSDVEYNEKVDRADDALRATRCAMTEGVVPGAGYCYLKATKCDELLKLLNSSNVGEAVGAKIIQKVLTVPFKKLLTNAGMEDEIGGIMAKVISGSKGYNLKTKKFEDLMESGVLDPWMVTKSALRNAGSVAGMILTSEAIVADDEEMETVDVSQKLPTM